MRVWDGGEIQISYHKMYSDYCNNHTNAVATVNSLLKKNNSFKQFIEVYFPNNNNSTSQLSNKALISNQTPLSHLQDAQMIPVCNGPFVGYLIKPVQRICKYPLLLRVSHFPPPSPFLMSIQFLIFPPLSFPFPSLPFPP